MWTAYNGHVDCVRELLSFGADLQFKDNERNKTALDYARQQGRPEVVALLEGARIEHERFLAQLGSQTKPALRESLQPVVQVWPLWDSAWHGLSSMEVPGQAHQIFSLFSVGWVCRPQRATSSPQRQSESSWCWMRSLWRRELSQPAQRRQGRYCQRSDRMASPVVLGVYFSSSDVSAFDSLDWLRTVHFRATKMLNLEGSGLKQELGSRKCHRR
eukprot:m.369661 g.369661  ORF g.369661 m.369661 type:complete len:215 (+) comp56118_c0_seq16:430-1074(+)